MAKDANSVPDTGAGGTGGSRLGGRGRTGLVKGGQQRIRAYRDGVDLGVSAIAFALEGDPRDYDIGAETMAFDVNVAPAA